MQWVGARRSGPARDLWIEIDLTHALRIFLLSGPARDLWIEIFWLIISCPELTSGPARDLWIEMVSSR